MTGRLDRLRSALGPGPEPSVARAPGRVNLIGEHTDYNEGLVLPVAIDRDCVLAYRPRRDAAVAVRSLDGADSGGLATAVGRALDCLGRPRVGVDGVLSSTVPIGAGLASSAAVEVAVALALCRAAGWELPPAELAEACRRAEHLATGVPCGMMDQLVSLVAEPGCATLIDCRSLSWRPVSVPDGAALVVADSGERRSLSESGYGDLRAACAEAASRLGLESLRDALPEQAAGDAIARHVVSENGRVEQMVGALAAGDWELAGRVLDAGHASLRDDLGVSTPSLDSVAEELRAAGAWGARLTGAGFGGCVVALAPPAAAAAMVDGRPDRWLVRPAAGALSA